ncbi:restriction endonuclease [Alkalibacillus haloalkaliphilus]|uniref:restriction endonuclease n=1 Tax=Alkalibacillus haloalkaliphilus TaxID=94136 RepID=UPI000313A6E6|nr:restriction endonuclease [Alkalibacillus haloalkaliphilus]
MGKPSRKKRKEAIYTVVAGPILFIGLWVMFQFSITSIYYIFGLVLFAVLMGGFASSFVPDMRKKENKSKNMYTGLPKQSNKKRNLNGSNQKKSNGLSSNSNILRSEKEIMTLPFEEISWREFEELCFNYYKAKGYKPRRTSEGADGGVDLIIFNRHYNAEIAIQIKHYKKERQIDVKLIRELDSAKKNHGCILAEMTTSSRFTNPALVEADKRNIVCRGDDWINSKLLPWREQQVKKKGLA